MRPAFLIALTTSVLAAQNLRTSPADVAAGAKTFRSHCSPCHGLRAEGGRGPNLASGRFYHGSTDADLLNNISNGIPGTEMPGLYYSADRIWQVIAYIRSLGARETVTTGNAQRGAQLFRSYGCPQCHRIAGEGGRLAPDLTAIGQSRSPDYLRRAIVDPNADVPEGYWLVTCSDNSGAHYEGFVMNEDTYSIQFLDMNEQLHSYAKSDLKDYRVAKVSKMPSYKGALSETQLSDLVAYLASLRPQGGAR